MRPASSTEQPRSTRSSNACTSHLGSRASAAARRPGKPASRKRSIRHATTRLRSAESCDRRSSIRTLHKRRQRATSYVAAASARARPREPIRGHVTRLASINMDASARRGALPNEMREKSAGAMSFSTGERADGLRHLGVDRIADALGELDVRQTELLPELSDRPLGGAAVQTERPVGEGAGTDAAGVARIARRSLPPGRGNARTRSVPPGVTHRDQRVGEGW